MKNSHCLKRVSKKSNIKIQIFIKMPDFFLVLKNVMN